MADVELLLSNVEAGKSRDRYCADQRCHIAAAHRTAPVDRRSPFANLSHDRGQEYFANGITEDLTTDLSHFSHLLVISRDTAFTYRDKPVNAKQIGRELGVRYVLEGSVQRSGTHIRVNAQLIDAETDTHLRAERFDRDIGDLFALQSEITGGIANALKLELARTEAARPTDDPDALDFIFRGRSALFAAGTPEKFADAIKFFEHAAPHAMLAAVYALNGETERAAAELAEARRLSPDNRYSSLAGVKAAGLPGSRNYWGEPKVRALFGATYSLGCARLECRRTDRRLAATRATVRNSRTEGTGVGRQPTGDRRTSGDQAGRKVATSSSIVSQCRFAWTIRSQLAHSSRNSASFVFSPTHSSILSNSLRRSRIYDAIEDLRLPLETAD